MPLLLNASKVWSSVWATQSGTSDFSLTSSLSLSNSICLEPLLISISHWREVHFSGDRNFSCLVSHCWMHRSNSEWLGSICLWITTPGRRSFRFSIRASLSTGGIFLELLPSGSVTCCFSWASTSVCDSKRRRFRTAVSPRFAIAPSVACANRLKAASSNATPGWPCAKASLPYVLKWPLNQHRSFPSHASVAHSELRNLLLTSWPLEHEICTVWNKSLSAWELKTS